MLSGIRSMYNALLVIIKATALTFLKNIFKC